MELTRRNYLAATGGALMAAAALPSQADDRESDGDADILYGHGMV